MRLIETAGTVIIMLLVGAVLILFLVLLLLLCIKGIKDMIEDLWG